MRRARILGWIDGALERVSRFAEDVFHSDRKSVETHITDLWNRLTEKEEQIAQIEREIEALAVGLSDETAARKAAIAEEIAAREAAIAEIKAQIAQLNTELEAVAADLQKTNNALFNPGGYIARFLAGINANYQSLADHKADTETAHGADTAASANSIARRLASGALNVGAPTANGHAVRYRDLLVMRDALEKIINELANDFANLEYLADVELDEVSGHLRIIRQDDTFLEVHIPGIVSDAKLSGNDLILTFAGGEQITIPLGSLIPIYTGSTGDHIQISIDPVTLKVSAVLRAGSVGGDRLANNIALPGTPTVGTRAAANANNMQVADTGWVRARIGEISIPSAPGDIGAEPARSVVSREEAEAGTATTARAWTAQRVRQAINAVTGSISTALTALTNTVNGINILINGDFRQGALVNQPGRSEYVGTGTGFDGWFNHSGRTRINIMDDFVRITLLQAGGNTGPQQLIEFPDLYRGLVVTLSIRYRTSSTVASFRITPGGTINLVPADTWAIAHQTFTLTGDAQIVARLGFLNTSPTPEAVGDHVDVQAVKLELGTVSTLANNPPAKHGDTFVRCSRFQRVYAVDNIDTQTQTSPPMRIQPVITQLTEGVNAGMFLYDANIGTTPGIAPPKPWPTPEQIAAAPTTHTHNASDIDAGRLAVERMPAFNNTRVEVGIDTVNGASASFSWAASNANSPLNIAGVASPNLHSGTFWRTNASRIAGVIINPSTSIAWLCSTLDNGATWTAINTRSYDELFDTPTIPATPGDIGAAPAVHQHNAADINAGTLAVARMPRHDNVTVQSVLTANQDWAHFRWASSNANSPVVIGTGSGAGNSHSGIFWRQGAASFAGIVQTVATSRLFHCITSDGGATWTVQNMRDPSFINAGAGSENGTPIVTDATGALIPLVPQTAAGADRANILPVSRAQAGLIPQIELPQATGLLSDIFTAESATGWGLNPAIIRVRHPGGNREEKQSAGLPSVSVDGAPAPGTSTQEYLIFQFGRGHNERALLAVGEDDAAIYYKNIQATADLDANNAAGNGAWRRFLPAGNIANRTPWWGTAPGNTAGSLVITTASGALATIPGVIATENTLFGSVSFMMRSAWLTMGGNAGLEMFESSRLSMAQNAWLNMTGDAGISVGSAGLFFAPVAGAANHQRVMTFTRLGANISLNNVFSPGFYVANIDAPQPGNNGGVPPGMANSNFHLMVLGGEQENRTTTQVYISGIRMFIRTHSPWSNSGNWGGWAEIAGSSGGGQQGPQGEPGQRGASIFGYHNDRNSVELWNDGVLPGDIVVNTALVNRNIGGASRAPGSVWRAESAGAGAISLDFNGNLAPANVTTTNQAATQTLPGITAMTVASWLQAARNTLRWLTERFNASGHAHRAVTADTLTTARTIGGVAFNGGANIDLPGVNAPGNQNTSGNAATATAISSVAARSVVGNGTASAGASGVITAGTDHHVLRRNGNTLGFGLITHDNIQDVQIIGGRVGIGRGANASENTSTALGFEANATGNSSTALGRQANASGSTSTSLGFETNATGSASTALGRAANASGRDSSALGSGSSAAGENSVSLGRGSSVATTGGQSVALGSMSNVTGTRANALGSNTSATHNHSTVIGSHGISVPTTAINQIRLGAPGATVLMPDGTTVVSDRRDKTDIKALDTKDFNSLDYINALEPVQYLKDPRENYTRQEEITKVEYDALGGTPDGIYTQRHFCCEYQVSGIEGTDIEWVDAFEQREPEADLPEKFRTRLISKFAKDQAAAISEFVRDNKTLRSRCRVVNGEIDASEMSKYLCSATYGTDDNENECAILDANGKVVFAGDISGINEIEIEVENSEAIAENLIIPRRKAIFRRVQLESDGTRSGSRRHWGFVAQQVYEAAQKMGVDCPAVQYLAHNKDEDGVPTGHDMYTLGPTQLIAPIVAALQQLSDMGVQQIARNDEFEARLAKLEKRLEAL